MNKYRILKWQSSFILIALLSACEDKTSHINSEWDISKEYRYYLEVDKQDIELGALDTQAEFTINSNGFVNVSSDMSWCRPSVNGSHVSVSLDINPELSTRKATIALQLTEDVTINKTVEIFQESNTVDLGLPSGTLWATFNVGASRPEEYGEYYRFGEIETRDYYGIDNYNDDYIPLLTPIIYKSDSYLASLKNEYDVANVKWGSCWNLPSIKQIEELYCYCSAESELLNGVLCTKLTGPNGNSIYLPLNGYYNGDTIHERTSQGRYQCGETVVSLDDNTIGGFLSIYVLNNYVDYTVYQKAIYGLGVRPVQRPRQEILPTSATIDKDNVQMQVGETITLTGTIYPENATYKYGTWSTYDDQIVSIDKFTGKVTAKSSGTAKVYFSDTYQYLFEAICTIIVK